MNTLEFLRAILPDEGVYYLALIDRQTGRVSHKPFVSLEDMAIAAMTYDDGEQFSVYHACASYKQRSIDVEVDGKNKRKFRVPDNWKAAKSLWIDLDCGEEKAAKGDGYPTKRDACKAIYKFCDTYSFPRPMLVDSGNGIHCYWPLTKAISPDVWRKLANVFKVVLGHAGVLADPTCTADFSRILRPVGTVNKKNEHKAVEVKKVIEPLEPQLIADRLRALMSEFGVLPEPVKQSAVDVNDDLTSHAPPKIPAFAEVAATKCAQLGQMRDTQGDVGYEHWRGVIGVIHHCEEGIELAHTWSARRADTGHAQVDVETKYNTWSAGPTTCEFFSKANPEACAGCMHKGKITSPIILGRVVPEPKVETVEAISEGEMVTIEVPPLPRGYQHEDGKLARLMQDKDGITHSFVFSNDLFYPYNRIRKEDGTFSMSVRVHLPNKKTREFQIDAGLLGDTATRLSRALGEYEVLPTNHKDSTVHLHAYMKDWLTKLKTEVDEINTLTTFGWHNEGQSFLIGDRLYHRDGTMRKVLLGGMASDKVNCLPPPKGTVEGYAHGLNAIYAREGMEPMQYVLASGFGCVLTPFTDPQYHGLMLSVVGGESGKGKTTVCNMAMTAFGNAEMMQVAGDKGATTNARYSLLAAFKNIPMLMDELTSATPEQLSELSYQVSMGHEKERLRIKNSVVRFSDAQVWQLSPYTTANNSIHGKLSALNANSQAEAVRVIEINIDQHPKTRLTHEEIEPMRRIVLMNQGSAGEAYVRYVVTNIEEVLDVMSRVGKRIHEDIPDSKFRFYRYHAMCTMAALHVTNKLGITRFDEEGLYQYAVSLFRQLADSVAQNNSLTPEDALSSMISELSPRIITTYEYRALSDGRGPETPTKRINGTPAGRYVIGSPNSKTPEMDGKLFLARKDASDWCMKNRMGLKEILDYAQSIGVLIPYKQKFTLGRGTDIKTGNTTVICLDQNRLEQMVGNDVKLVIHTGGKASNVEQVAV